MHLMAALEGPAMQLLHSCKDRLTYVTLLDKLHRRYSSEHEFERYRYELRTRRQRNNESLQALCDDVEKMASLGYPDCTVEDREKWFTLPAFLDAIADRNLGSKSGIRSLRRYVTPSTRR